MPRFAAAIASAITKATTRKDAAEETGAATETVHPPPRAVGMQSDGAVLEYHAINALGVNWAVGLIWSDGDFDREEGLQRARARVADAKRREAREGKASLIVVRPVAVGETEHFYEQYGLAREVYGQVERKTRSLGARIASQWKTGSVAGLFRVEPEAAYFIVVQNGVIRPGTDRCYASYPDAMNALAQLAKMMGEDGWRVVLSPEHEETGIPALAESGTEVQHLDLADLLSSDEPAPVLKTIYFQLPRRAKRAGAVTLLVALALIFWWGYDLKGIDFIKKTYESHAAKFEQPPKPAPPPPPPDVVPAPWNNAVRAPAEWLAHCLSGIEQVPMISVPPRYVAGESAFREVVSVACDGHRLRVLRDSLIEVDIGFAGKSSEDIALPGTAGPTSNGVAWAGFTPVWLESLETKEFDSEEGEVAVEMDVRNILIEVVDAVGAATMYLVGGEVHPGAVETGLLKDSRKLGWATLGFQITTGNIAIGDAGRWLEMLAEVKAVQLTDVLWSPGSGWVLNGFVAGTTKRGTEALAQEISQRERTHR